MPRKFYIGATEWAGLSKLIEEAGEVCQVAGKIIATDGREVHWDGTNLHERLLDELADLGAAISFVLNRNYNYRERSSCYLRQATKRNLFDHWHRANKSDAT